MTSPRSSDFVPLGLSAEKTIEFSENGCVVNVFGKPSVNHSALKKDDQFRDLTKDPIGFARSLDGEFFILSESSDQLTLISDRFASRPLFYAVVHNQFVYSFSYSELWNRLKVEGALIPDRYAVFEFLKFQRLFGEKTLDQTSKMIPTATVMTVDRQTLEIAKQKFWQPDFSKSADSLQVIASKLGDAICTSINTRTEGVEKVGLLLSGGMDSRVVLGGFDTESPPQTFTVGSYENNEVRVARELAAKSGAMHHFVQRESNHYADILSAAAFQGGSMYSYQHGHFFNLTLPTPVDLLLHGHGFDYMFQGMYLPASRRSFLGKPTRSYKLSRTSGSIVDAYLNTAKYRLKSVALEELVQANEIHRVNDAVRHSLESVMSEVENRVAEEFDIWDYLTFGSPGRHYTYLNLISAGSLAPQQTVAWDNDIFDLFYSTPAEVRFGTKLLAETIKNLRPSLLEVRNANTNLSPKIQGARLTVAGWRRGFGRRLGLSRFADPGAADRSWPSNDQIASDSKSLADRVEGLATSPGLSQLDLFNLQAVQKIVDRSRKGQPGTGSAILTLLTLDDFLSVRL